MSRPETATFAKALRDLADYYEARPGLPVPYQTNVSCSLSSREETAQAAVAMGSCEKKYDDNYFSVIRYFGPGQLIKVEFFVHRQAVCRKKIVGTKVVPESVQVVPAHTEDIVEWECFDEPSLLRPAETPALPQADSVPVLELVDPF